MSVPAKIYQLKFEKLNFIQHEDWQAQVLKKRLPGDLLLGPGRGEEFSLLCISDVGAFLSLTYDQVYKQHPIFWPDHTGTISRVQIIGDVIKFY